jgi:conjugal transfer pilus assembly protein TraE
MKVTLISKEAASRLGVKQWIVTLLGLLVLSNVLLTGLLLVRGNNHRETLVPPVIHQSFWVEDDKVSKEYLMEMGVFLAQLFFDVTPDNVTFNHDHLKKYVHPRFYGALENNANGYAERMKRDNSSTFLSISSLVPDERNARVAIRGILHTYVGDRRVASLAKTYAFGFAFNSGRVLLTSIKETNDKDLFGDNANAPQ